MPRSIGKQPIFQIVFGLMKKAGIILPGDPYVLRVHSLRKFFKTQLISLGVQPDYIDYTRGHTIDTYHDIQSKDIEFLRSIYASKNFSIRPQPKLSPIEQVKAFCRGLGAGPRVALGCECLRRAAQGAGGPGGFRETTGSGSLRCD